MSQLTVALAGVIGLALFSYATAAPAGATTLTLKADELRGGFDAQYTLLKDGAVVLDDRNGVTAGRIVTDVIDLGGEGNLAQVKVGGLTVQAQSEGHVAVSVRHGPNYFQSAGWSDWLPVQADKAVDVAGHRYVQLRLALEACKCDQAADKKPAVKAVTLAFAAEPADVGPPVKIVENKVQRIVRSPIEFGYERMDQADMKWLRESARLDEVIKDKKSELDKLIALNLWVAQRKNVRGPEAAKRLGRGTPWNIRKVFGPEDGGTIYGHCASYCEVFVFACVSLGWQGRHIADLGYDEHSHETAEVWVNELGKWVYFDPSLSAYYVDKRTGLPMNSVEMHDMLLANFFKPGEPVKPITARGSRSFANKRRATCDPTAWPVEYKTFDYTYGEKKPFDWTRKQGLMCKAYIQMTPRNNFHSQPKPQVRDFGNYPLGHNGMPCWTDEQTGLWDGKTRNWFTRQRDWYWTLNQASLRLTAAGTDTLGVELGNSQPFFKHYLVTANGNEQLVAGSEFAWKLVAGRNTLTVTPVDEFGQKGIASSVTVERQ